MTSTENVSLSLKLDFYYSKEAILFKGARGKVKILISGVVSADEVRF
jgi:hypothetical protein